MEEKKMQAEEVRQQAVEEGECRKHPRTAITWKENIPAKKRYNDKLRE